MRDPGLGWRARGPRTARSPHDAHPHGHRSRRGRSDRGEPPFKPYLVNRLGSQAFLVKAGGAEEITAKLLEFGFAVGNDVILGIGVPEAIE